MAKLKWGAVVPPKKKGRAGTIVAQEDAEGLYDAVFAEDAEWIAHPDTFDTKGKAVSAAIRFRRALLDYEMIEDMGEVRSRVWSDSGDDAGPWRFALRARIEETE